MAIEMRKTNRLAGADFMSAELIESEESLLLKIFHEIWFSGRLA